MEKVKLWMKAEMSISKWILILKHIPLTILPILMSIWTVNHQKKTKGKRHDGKQSLHEKPNRKNENEVRSYRKHGDDVKEQLFFLVYEKSMTPGQAAKQLGVNRRTAYNWVEKDQENP
ncbi:hypothetical protein K501DRAFT_281150, partial [Backusella circina FSU 941]